MHDLLEHVTNDWQCVTLDWSNVGTRTGRKDWLRENVGHANYVIDYGDDSPFTPIVPETIRYLIKDEKLATLFILRWS